MKNIARVVAAFASLSFAALSPSAVLAGPNLLENGGFETGDFTGWVSDGSFTGVVPDSFYLGAHSGNYWAALGNIGFFGELYQGFPTKTGETYELTYWLASDGATPNFFGTATIDSGGFTVLDAQFDIPFQDYTEYKYKFKAAGDFSILYFGQENDPGYLGLDDVSITAVPEPGTVAFGLIAAGSVLGLVARKRNKS